MSENSIESLGGKESRGRVLKNCGSNLSIHNYAESRGLGHVRIRRLVGGWETYIVGLSFSPSSSATPEGYGGTIDEAYRDLVTTIKGQQVYVFRPKSRFDPKKKILYVWAEWEQERVPCELTT